MELFVTGTDTDIGKTWVCAALAHEFLKEGKSVGYYKPIQTGSPPGEAAEDVAFINTHTNNAIHTYNRYCFEPPVTPSVADTDGSIDPQCIATDVANYGKQHDLLLVEGAGGLAVPIADNYLMIDLIKQLNIPTLLVSHCRLGTINHTLLSIEALLAKNIPLYGLVINHYPTDPRQSPLAVQTLIPTLRSHLPDTLPLYVCYTSDAPQASWSPCP